MKKDKDKDIDSSLYGALKGWKDKLKVDLIYPAVDKRSPFCYIKDAKGNDIVDSTLEFATRGPVIGDTKKRILEVRYDFQENLSFSGILYRMTSPHKDDLSKTFNLYSETACSELCTKLLNPFQMNEMIDRLFTVESLETQRRYILGNLYTFDARFKSNGAPIQLVVLPWTSEDIPKPERKLYTLEQSPLTEDLERDK